MGPRRRPVRPSHYQGPFPTDICISAANAYRQANRLPAAIRGDDKPKDAAERLALAYIAYYMEHFGASARLFAGPIQYDRQLAEDMTAQNRYNAACAAALASAGKGNDKPTLSEPERAQWRKQAVVWLKADLDHWTKLVWSAPDGLVGERNPRSLESRRRPGRHPRRGVIERSSRR